MSENEPWGAITLPMHSPNPHRGPIIESARGCIVEVRAKGVLLLCEHIIACVHIIICTILWRNSVSLGTYDTVCKIQSPFLNDNPNDHKFDSADFNLN